MPIIRNPFRKQDENARPGIPTFSSSDKNSNNVPKIDVSGSEKQAEYKLSEINDSGVCLPPSPSEERKSFWGGTSSSRSTTSSSVNHRSLVKENEPFNISRESFDSYRRSFDISGRSPIIGPSETGAFPRASLDSRTFQPTPRKSNQFVRPSPGPMQPQAPTKEEDFEDVGLEDPKPAPKKRGIFSRLTDSVSTNADSAPVGSVDARPASGHDKWHFPGNRKRGQSGQGAELGSMPRREENGTPKPESGLRRSETPKPGPEENAQAPK